MLWWRGAPVANEGLQSSRATVNQKKPECYVRQVDEELCDSLTL